MFGISHQIFPVISTTLALQRFSRATITLTYPHAGACSATQVPTFVVFIGESAVDHVRSTWPEGQGPPCPVTARMSS